MEELELLFGTTDVATVLAKKTTEKQVRAFASGTEGPVKLTADECKKLCKALNDFEYLRGYEDRVHGYTITDETADRYGDIVRAKGVVLDNYMKNPVVQFAHDYSLPPVGVSLKTWYDKAKKGVRSWPLFFDDRIDSTGRADLIFRFVRSNGMRACSIGFNALSWSVPDTDEDREKMGLGRYGVEFTSVDLLEFSPVPVPANPNALSDAYGGDYRKALRETLRNGDFSQRDVRTLLAYPLFETSVLDEFIATLGAGTVPVTKDPPAEPPAAPVEPTAVLEATAEPVVVNVNIDLAPVAQALKEINENITTAVRAIADDTVQRLTTIQDSVNDALTSLGEKAPKAPKESAVSVLYDSLGLKPRG